MSTQIVKWGNAQGIRIPKKIMEECGLRLNGMMEESLSKKHSGTDRWRSGRLSMAGSWDRIRNMTGENRKAVRYGDGKR